MRRLIYTVVILFAASATAARAEQVTAAELQALAQYTQLVQQVYQQGMAVSLSLEETALRIDDFANGADIAKADLQARTERELSLARERIDQYEQSLAVVGNRRPIPDAKREAGMQAFEAMVRALKGQLEAQRDNVAGLLAAALAGDEPAFDLATADSLALTGDMLRSENTAMEATQQGVKRSHPQHGLYDSITGANLAMMAALMLMEDAIRKESYDLDAAHRTIRQGLKRAELGLKEGRLSSRTMRDKMAGTPVRNKSDEISKQFLVDFTASYDRAFEIEALVYGEMRVFVDALTVAMKSQNADDVAAMVEAAELFQANVGGLIERRLTEQNDRVRMVEDYSAALSALQ